MGDFSAADAALAGFGFARRHPKTIAVWAAIILLFHFAFTAAMVVIAGPALTALQALNASGSRDPAVVFPLMQRLLPLYALIVPAMLLLFSVLLATVNRAVLREGDDRYAFLRLGGDELRQFILIVYFAAVIFAAEIVGVLAMVVVMILLALAGPALGFLRLIPVLALICALIFLEVRLSLAFALTFDSGRVTLFGSWTLTRGRFWKLLGTYLLVFVLGLVVYLLILMIAVALAAAVGGGLDGVGALFKTDMSSLPAYFTPVRLVAGVVSALASALVWPLFLMPAPDIYRQLKASAPLSATPDPVG